MGYEKDKQGFWRPKIKKGIYVWSPPPAAADACLEELRKARMKRKMSTHIIVIQKLFTTNWMRQLNKIADCHFSIPPCHPFWNPNNFEPLIIAFVFPFLPFRPWQLQSTPKMLFMGRKLCQVFKTQEMDTGDILLKFLLECWKLPSMSPDVVWRMLYFNSKGSVPHSKPNAYSHNARKRKRQQGERTASGNLERESKKSKRLLRGKRRRPSDDPL